MEGEGVEEEEVVRRIYERLAETGGDSLCRRELSVHFDRLPRSYLFGLSADKAEDVLLHRRLLADAADISKRPVVHARSFNCIHHRVAADETSQPELLRITGAVLEVELLLHEIIFASVDRPRLLSQLSALASDVGLNIREAHVFTTADGFSLSIFLVDGWHQEEAYGLLKAIKEKMARRRGDACKGWRS